MDFNFLKNYGLFFDILNFGLNEEMREIFVVFVICLSIVVLYWQPGQGGMSTGGSIIAISGLKVKCRRYPQQLAVTGPPYCYNPRLLFYTIIS